jgi:hypothetical protein
LIIRVPFNPRPWENPLAHSPPGPYNYIEAEDQGDLVAAAEDLDPHHRAPAESSSAFGEVRCEPGPSGATTLQRAAFEFRCGYGRF